MSIDLEKEGENKFHPDYFKVQFITETQHLPDEFVIISAYATTGETWTDEKNEAADLELFSVLNEKGLIPIRITGYSPETGHSEPSWAVEASLMEGLNIGYEFKQDAIFHVLQQRLYLVKCGNGRQSVEVGSFIVHTQY